MKLFFHYCPFGFSNCYVIGSDYNEKDTLDSRREPGNNPSKRPPAREALVIDPGNMDEQILSFIEDNEYSVLAVLVTHDHPNHVHGLRTLRRIYNMEIYGVNHIIQEIGTTMVRDGDVIRMGSFEVTVISVPGHSADSAVFRINHLLFTGDSLSAGLVGRTASSYGAAVQMNALRSKILSLPGNYLVFPGHGPPTSLEAERRFNAGVRLYDQTRSQRPLFKVDI
ncbi:MAG: MBL fold metallo-hydrolase [Treponema sp.]|jgi:glyoxylase-like metal-dependent hydrolase (beta-lactamase superfamily II)|nr:MBL fold metallo-hydrolase [Treponema sp.]